MRTILATLISLSALGALSQRIFINQLPEYSKLPSCAEPPLSNIVRNMASGCGDGGKTTSYSCFCVSSSAKFESVISKAVSSKCAPASSDAAVSALSVFDKYCHISSLPQGWCPLSIIVSHRQLIRSGVHRTGIVTAPAKHSWALSLLRTKRNQAGCRRGECGRCGF
ncbi:hypothetical protein QBC43DRAFT_308544 [Cladorrhinum sp. PSN259]|nr:hypothetical protein QBC43DRAFT_308544 [Cladorrhinum sp. PSN259]